MLALTKKLLCILGLVCSIFAPTVVQDAYGRDHQEELYQQQYLSVMRAERFKYARTAFKVVTNHSQVLADVEKAINTYDPTRIWVVYDIDECLTYPDHPASAPDNYRKVHKRTLVSIIQESGLDCIQESMLWNLKYRIPPSRLTDDNILTILEKLKNYGVKTIGLTASMAGAVVTKDDCQYMARCKVLKDLGVVFSVPDEEIIFNEFLTLHGSHPVYYNGVGFSQTSGDYGSTTKGEFLIALAKKWGAEPKLVIFVDDSPTNLHRFAQIMEENNIPCYCYQFESERVNAPREISEQEYRQVIENYVSIVKSAT